MHGSRTPSVASGGSSTSSPRLVHARAELNRVVDCAVGTIVAKLKAELQNSSSNSFTFTHGISIPLSPATPAHTLEDCVRARLKKRIAGEVITLQCFGNLSVKVSVQRCHVNAYLKAYVSGYSYWPCSHQLIITSPRHPLSTAADVSGPAAGLLAQGSSIEKAQACLSPCNAISCVTLTDLDWSPAEHAPDKADISTGGTSTDSLVKRINSAVLSISPKAIRQVSSSWAGGSPKAARLSSHNPDALSGESIARTPAFVRALAGCRTSGSWQ